ERGTHATSAVARRRTSSTVAGCSLLERAAIRGATMGRRRGLPEVDEVCSAVVHHQQPVVAGVQRREASDAGNAERAWGPEDELASLERHRLDAILGVFGVRRRDEPAACRKIALELPNFACDALNGA